MIAVASGSKEELIVEITDHRGLLSDLASAGAKYEVTDDAGAFLRGDGTYANAEGATGIGMTIVSEVDHNESGVPWATGNYALYVWFTDGTQKIRRGPYWYKVT